MEWFHIRNKQPEHGESIVQVDPPSEGHYTMGMRNYFQPCSFEEVLEFCNKHGLDAPDFWWGHTKDFPWPDKLKRNDPIDEHEMEKIIEAVQAAEKILAEIPYRQFSIKIKEEVYD